MRTVIIIMAGCLLAAAAGCEEGKTGRTFLTEKVNTLRDENAQLKSEVKQSQAEVEQLKEQVQVLSELPKDVRLENLYDLQKVKIGRYTNIYDKNKDGKKEKLIVYIQPIDQQDDVIKASGSVDVQLWDLDRKSGDALLGQWTVTPAELKDLWFATLITINYRLTFDVADKIIGDEDALVVKVTFTDYLRGRVFKVEKILKPRGD